MILIVCDEGLWFTTYSGWPGPVLGSVGTRKIESALHVQREEARPGGHTGSDGVCGPAALLPSWVSLGRQSPHTSVPPLSVTTVRIK